MKIIAGLLLSCFVGMSLGSCSKEEPPVALVGKWQITEWKADHVDQLEAWRIENLTVEFRDDGTVESQLVYTNGDERSTGGTWKREESDMEIHVKGGSDAEGDEPFERTREFTIDELTADGFTVRAEIGPADKPIVLTYKAERLPGAE